ncbi:PepSY domain-containing protein [Sneathiella sp.]|uniref:PepSY domain-containing protein n=1 Tax=Sneathiella sp. TaxID=1964365 RepID=UPI00262F381F|nr:PepSY domain-containing protein [Sneathiella sp.]MDF2366046.1 PepSY domain-containing protein [Sneathiella sp.]
MKKYLIAATFVTGLAGLGTMGMALADDDDCRVPMADWQPRDAVQNMAEAQGWTVRRIKTDDGCYEIKGRDAQGREIEVKIDPGTLAIVEMEYDDDDDDDDDRGGRDRNQTPTGTGQPPANGLFVPGSKPGAVVQ